MSEKYSFIDAQKAVRNADGSARYTVVSMCTWLAVSTSGFYDWARRPLSATAAWRAELAEVIEAVFAESDGTYGYRRIHAELVRRGRPCHRETVRAIMGERSLVACQPKARRRALTKPAAQVGHIPDLVARDFTSAVPGAKLVSDITYVRTWLRLGRAHGGRSRVAGAARLRPCHPGVPVRRPPRRYRRRRVGAQPLQLRRQRPAARARPERSASGHRCRTAGVPRRQPGLPRRGRRLGCRTTGSTSPAVRW